MKSSVWYKVHTGKKSEHQKRWRSRHPHTAEMHRQERKKYPGMNAKACRKWYQGHKAHFSALVSARRAAVKGMWKSLSKKQQEKIIKIYERAAELRQWFDVVVDHKIPLCKKGQHHPSNLQIIYDHENRTKGSRTDFIPSVIFT